MSATAMPFDITTVDTDNHEKLVNTINEFYRLDGAAKTQLSWHWDKNQMMLDGKQWLVYDGEAGSGGAWKKLKVSDSNAYIPRPVTNYLFEVYQTLKSYVIKNKPRSSIKPNTQAYTDKVAAKIGNLILESNWEKLGENNNYEVAASMLVTYGTVFKKSFWDTATVQLVKIPKIIEVPVNDPNTGAPIGTQQQQATDKDGLPLFDELPLGDINTSIIEPHRISIDPLAMTLKEARWIMEYSLQSLQQVVDIYDQDGEGFTGNVKEVKPDSSLNPSLQRWYQQKTSAGTKSEGYGKISTLGPTEQILQNSVVVKEYYERPSRKYPKGRMIVVAGDQILYASQSPYEGPEHGDWHPYSECRWEIVPGRFWGKSPLDDATEIQKQVNSIDSVIILTRKTMAIPQKLIPMGNGVAPGQWNGRPGLEVYYRADGTGAKPETIGGAGVDQSVFAERAQRVSDLKEISGAIDILRGDKPPTVSAASALNLLYEIGTGKLYPILDRWKMFVESDQKKQLRLIAKKYKEPRPDFIRMLLAKNKDLSDADIKNFIGSDLNDNFNVIVEAGSNLPKLQAAYQALLIEMAQMGSLNLQSAPNRLQFHQDLGIKGYDEDIEPDRKRAEWENDLMDNMLNSPDNHPVVLDCDNHALHIEEHHKRMKSPTFMTLPQEIQQAYIQHTLEHENFINQKMQADAMQQLSIPSGGMPPLNPNVNQGNMPVMKGQLPKEIKNALHGHDVLTPASLGNGSRG